MSIAFALRRDFQWRRVPGYIVVQLIGATLAALVLHEVITVSAKYGANYPAAGHSTMAAFWMELLLTTGLVSVILGTASGAQNVGLFGAIGVGGYIALAGLWGSPISGASMNPARTFGPDFVELDLHWLLGVCGRAPCRCRHSRGHRLRAAWARGRQIGIRGSSGRHLHRVLRDRKVLRIFTFQRRMHRRIPILGPQRAELALGDAPSLGKAGNFVVVVAP